MALPIRCHGARVVISVFFILSATLFAPDVQSSQSSQFTVTIPQDGDILVEGDTVIVEVLVTDSERFPDSSAFRLSIDGKPLMSFERDDVLRLDGVLRAQLHQVASGPHLASVELLALTDLTVPPNGLTHHNVVRQEVSFSIVQDDQGAPTADMYDNIDSHEPVSFDTDGMGTRPLSQQGKLQRLNDDVSVVVSDMQNGIEPRGSASPETRDRGSVDVDGVADGECGIGDSSGIVEAGVEVKIWKPTVNQVFRYQHDLDGAIALFDVQISNVDLVPGVREVVLLLNGKEAHRSTSSRIHITVGGLPIGTYLLSVELHSSSGVIGGGTRCAECVCPFKVDSRVWDDVHADVNDLFSRLDGGADIASEGDTVSEEKANNSEDGAIKLDLRGIYSWGGVVNAYAQFHSKALKAPPGTVDLYVYTPRDGGIGNRLIDLASSYMLAESPAVQRHMKAGKQGDSYLQLNLESLNDPRVLSEVIAGKLMVEYHVGPVIRLIYDDPTFTDSLAFGLMHSELGLALGDCIHAVIRPSPILERIVQERLQARESLIGVHVRVTMSSKTSEGGDSQIGPTSTVPLRRQGQGMLMLTTLALLRESNYTSSIVLATDNMGIRRAFLRHPELGSRLLSSQANIKHSAREASLDGQIDVWSDWWTLTRCTTLVLTRQSTFGYIAAGVAGVVPYTVHEHKVERRFHCGPFALCDMRPPDSGI